MTNENSGSVHWSFWAISGFALLWNIGGSLNFFMQMNPEAITSLPETHRAIIEGRPLWATAGFGVAVFGGALGALLLLLRKPAALLLFKTALIGAAITMVHTIRIAASPVNFSAVEIFVMIIMPLAVAAFLVWYAKKPKAWAG